MPEELLAAHRRLAENDKTKDKNQKPVDKPSKPPEAFEIGSDADMEDAAADQDLDSVRKNFEEKKSKKSVLKEFSFAIPPELAAEVEELQERLREPDKEEAGDAEINELRKQVNKASSKAFQASELHKKNLEKTRLLRQQLEDMEATNDLSAEAAEEAQKVFAEATEKLNEKIKQVRAKKQKGSASSSGGGCRRPALYRSSIARSGKHQEPNGSKGPGDRGTQSTHAKISR